MFRSICVRCQTPLYKPDPINLGFLAEAMVFYKDVHLIADRDILIQLSKNLGPYVLEALIDEKFLRISYLNKVYYELSIWTPYLPSRIAPPIVTELTPSIRPVRPP